MRIRLIRRPELAQLLREICIYDWHGVDRVCLNGLFVAVFIITHFLIVFVPLFLVLDFLPTAIAVRLPIWESIGQAWVDVGFYRLWGLVVLSGLITTLNLFTRRKDPLSRHPQETTGQFSNRNPESCP